MMMRGMKLRKLYLGLLESGSQEMGIEKKLKKTLSPRCPRHREMAAHLATIGAGIVGLEVSLSTRIPSLAMLYPNAGENNPSRSNTLSQPTGLIVRRGDRKMHEAQRAVDEEKGYEIQTKDL